MADWERHKCSATRAMVIAQCMNNGGHAERAVDWWMRHCQEMAKYINALGVAIRADIEATYGTR